MSPSDRFADYHRRLDELEGRLEKAARHVERTAPPAHHYVEEARTLRTRVAGLRGKVGTHEPAWEAARRELAEEWQELTHAFDHWLTRVDERFKER